MHKKTVYTDVCEINRLQRGIMSFINEWVHKSKKPVARSKVIERMKKNGIGEPTTINALEGLLEKGYIRKAEIKGNRTYYVQLRTVSL